MSCLGLGLLVETREVDYARGCAAEGYRHGRRWLDEPMGGRSMPAAGGRWEGGS